MELPNESASFVVIFVLFCFHLGRICDLCFSQKCGKAFIHRTKIYCLAMTLYEAFNRLQAFLFTFCGESNWESKENTFCTLG